MKIPDLSNFQVEFACFNLSKKEAEALTSQFAISKRDSGVGAERVGNA